MAEPSSIVKAAALAQSLSVESTTILNNLTTVFNTTNFIGGESQDLLNATKPFEESIAPDDDIHKNPELKYFSTVIIICMGLTILIVPVFCFVGFVCAKARIFKTVREAAGKGWGFGDADVPYGEFGSDDYPKDSSESKACDVKILVADDNTVPSNSEAINSFHTRSQVDRRNPRGNFLAGDSDEDISSLPPTFVCQ